MTRITALAAALALATVGIAPAAAEYPEKPIQVIVPAGPGSATDTITRLVLNKITEQKHVPLIEMLPQLDEQVALEAEVAYA